MGQTMIRMRLLTSSLAVGLALATSAVSAQSVAPVVVPVPAPPARAFKLKIAIGRFTNETRYGRSLLTDAEGDPLGKQASDILAAYLTQTGRFLVLERQDIGKIEGEQSRAAGGNTIGADVLIIGSVVEFGRTEDGKQGLFNSGRVQRAHAKVAIRLVDVRTGLMFHSATGDGEATTETKLVLGLGSTSAFDGTLTDKALSVAVEDMLEGLVGTLAARPWKTALLAVDGSQVFIGAGERQGVRVGDHLKVMRSGKKIRNPQTGFEIELPASEVAELEVISLFGESDTNEGAVARLASGSLDPATLSDYVVTGK